MPDHIKVDETDEVIMRRFCETLDDKLFHILAVRYYDSALRIANERLGNETLAKDAVQETLIRVVRHCKRYDSSKPFSHWFYTVLRNTCTDLYRREARHQQALNDFVESDQQTSATPADGTPQARAIELVSSLPHADAELLRLRYLEAFSFKEIGARLNCSLETAKKRVQRLIVRLKS